LNDGCEALLQILQSWCKAKEYCREYFDRLSTSFANSRELFKNLAKIRVIRGERGSKHESLREDNQRETVKLRSP